MQVTCFYHTLKDIPTRSAESVASSLVQSEQTSPHEGGEGDVGQADERDDVPRAIAVELPGQVGEPGEDSRADDVTHGEQRELGFIRSIHPRSRPAPRSVFSSRSSKGASVVVRT